MKIKVAVCGSCLARYPGDRFGCPSCGNITRKLGAHDSARVLLDRVPPSQKTVHKDGCYICEDDEFQRLGMPLCYECIHCNGHVPADDDKCDACGKGQRE